MISTVDLANGTIYALEGGPLAKNYFPVWSPDSKSIAYSATAYSEPNYYSLIQIESRTGQDQRTVAVSNCFATPVDWSPDGSKIAYLSGCTTAEFASQLWIVDIRDQMPMNVVSGGRITALQWSPRGRKVPKSMFTSHVYRVSFPYPANWRPVSEEIRGRRRFLPGIRDFVWRPDSRCMQLRGISSINALRFFSKDCPCYDTESRSVLHLSFR